MALCNQPFWRPNVFSPAEKELWVAVGAAHRASCTRDNLSVTAFKLAEYGSGKFTSGVIGALSTLGGPHGPIEQTYRLFMSADPDSAARAYLDRGEKVPGFGNSFHKGEPDPKWAEVDYILRSKFPAQAERMESVFRVLGGKVFPNPSTYTALTAIIVGLPEKLAPYIFVAARLEGWAAQA